MIIITQNSFEKTKNAVESAKSKPVVFTSDNDDLNRKVLEKLNIDILLLNQEKRKDYSKQRNSGFNQVLAKIAKKKNTVIGINLDEIILAKEIAKAQILSRVKQNITLCKKQKLKMTFITKRKTDKNSLVSIGLVIGMPTNMLKFFN